MALRQVFCVGGNRLMFAMPWRIKYGLHHFITRLYQHIRDEKK